MPGFHEDTRRSSCLTLTGALRVSSSATGDEYRIRIDIPNRIEFERAKIGSATTTAPGAIELDLRDSYGQFNILRHTGSGGAH